MFLIFIFPYLSQDEDMGEFVDSGWPLTMLVLNWRSSDIDNVIDGFQRSWRCLFWCILLMCFMRGVSSFFFFLFFIQFFFFVLLILVFVWDWVKECWSGCLAYLNKSQKHLARPSGSGTEERKDGSAWSSSFGGWLFLVWFNCILVCGIGVFMKCFLGWDVFVVGLGCICIELVCVSMV